MAWQKFEKQIESRHKNSSHVFALVIGQCSQALWNWMEASEWWSRINEALDVMALLQLVQNCMIQRQTRQEPVHSLFDAEAHVYNFKQKGLPNN